MKLSRRNGLVRFLISILLLTIAISIFLFRQQILDQLSVWQYQPSAEVAAIATNARMSSEGKFYFYASQPKIQDRASFNASCNTARGEQTAVLGCYVLQRIYVFNVTEPQLNGIREVTAAHEMLHAVYERLSQSERQHINSLLEAEAAKISDPVITALLAAYAKSEPGERLNELHSILGTQVARISNELEEYYHQYFIDRQSVVTLYQNYETVFENLKNQQAQLVSDLDRLNQEITAETSSYNQEAATLNADIQSFNQRANNGLFASQAEFNRERNALVARQQELQQIKSSINAKITEYNDKRQQLIAINAQAEALNRTINSNLSPVPNIQ